MASYLICWERCHIIENVDTKWDKKFPVMHGSNNTGDIVIIWRFLYLMSSTSYSAHICYCSALCEYVSLRSVLHSGCGRMVKINPSFHFNDMTVTGSFYFMIVITKRNRLQWWFWNWLRNYKVWTSIQIGTHPYGVSAKSTRATTWQRYDIIQFTYGFLT